MASYKIAAPDEYLAITGMGVKSVKICKAAWFLLPVVFTVGPDLNQRGANTKLVGSSEDPALHDAEDHADHPSSVDGVVESSRREDRGDSLMKYAILLAESNSKQQGNTHQFLENIVKGIIEGETRVLVSSMTMEEIFTEREVFKRRIFRNIRGELSQFGLKIYNANVKELKDAPNSVYFESLSRKAHESASNMAKVDVAEAQLHGNVGEAKRKGEQERELAKIHAETAVRKTERDVERAQAEALLSTKKAGLSRDVEIARIEANRATQAKDEDLKRDVEVRRAGAEMERLRASDVVKATIARESKQQAADASAYEVEADARANFEKSKRLADASAYKTKLDADAHATADFNRVTKNTDASAYKTKIDAEAWSHATITNAEAMLQKKLKEAEGLAAMAEAYAKMGQAFGGPAGLLQYMMIEKGTYVELAKANAAAIHGLSPKISVWNTGAAQGGEGGAPAGNSADAMRNIYQMLPPLMTTINEQTGITLPEWQFGRLAGQMSEAERAQGKVTTNGKK